MYYDTDDCGGIAWVSWMSCITRALLTRPGKSGLVNTLDPTLMVLALELARLISTSRKLTVVD